LAGTLHLEIVFDEHADELFAIVSIYEYLFATFEEFDLNDFSKLFHADREGALEQIF